MQIEITEEERALLILSLNGWVERIHDTITTPEQLEEIAPHLIKLETLLGKLREGKDCGEDLDIGKVNESCNYF